MAFKIEIDTITETRGQHVIYLHIRNLASGEIADTMSIEYDPDRMDEIRKKIRKRYTEITTRHDMKKTIRNRMEIMFSEMEKEDLTPTESDV